MRHQSLRTARCATTRCTLTGTLAKTSYILCFVKCKRRGAGKGRALAASSSCLTQCVCASATISAQKHAVADVDLAEALVLKRSDEALRM